MPSRGMPLHHPRAHALTISIDPSQKSIHILHLPISQRMEPNPEPFLPHTQPILTSHVLDRRQAGFARKDGRDRDGLVFEQGERGGEKGHADEGEGRIGDVEDVPVQIVDLGAVGDEDGAGGFGSRGAVAVVLPQEGERHVVSGAEDDAVDVDEDPAVLETDMPRDRLEGMIQLWNFHRQALETADLSRDADGARREQAGREVKGSAPGGLVNIPCSRAELTSDIGR